MNQAELLKILESVKAGELAPDKAIKRLKHLPFEDLGFAKVDHHRALRQGFAEVILGKGKTPQQVAEIVRAMLRKKDSRHNILVTRADKKIFAAVKRTGGKDARNAKFHELSGVITIERNPEITGKGTILVVSAGTSDIPVAEEALVTARMMGNRAEPLYDVGVAGIHRLLEHRESKLAQARVPASSAASLRCRSSPFPPASATAQVSAASLRSSACSIPAPPMSPSSTSTTVSAPPASPPASTGCSSPLQG